MEIRRILSRLACISLTFTVSSLIIKTPHKFSFFSLPRNSPPGHFLFLVPASGHPSHAVHGRRVICETLPGKHAQALFLPRCLPGIGALAAEVHRLMASPHFSQLLRYIQFHPALMQGRRCGYLFRSSRNCSHVVRPASSGDGRRWRQSVITENTQAFERQDRCPLHRHLPARHAFFAILHDTADSGTVSSASCSHGTRGRKENHRQACGVHGRGFASSSPHCAS